MPLSSLINICRCFAPQNHVRWSELSPRRYVVCPPPPPSPNAPLTNIDINRLVHPTQLIGSPEDSANLPDPRILILTVSPDASNSYIPVMNSIFSAQKLVSTTHTHPSPQPQPPTQKITIDVCKIFGSDSVFLQQAAYLTGGSYIYLEHREALLQYLIVRSIPSIDVEVTPSNSRTPSRCPSCLRPRFAKSSPFRQKTRRTFGPLASVTSTL